MLPRFAFSRLGSGPSALAHRRQRRGFCGETLAHHRQRSGFCGAASSSAQTSASLHPSRCASLAGTLPFTEDMGVHGLCGRVANSAGSICPQDCIAVICRKAMFTHPGANSRLPEHKNADFVLEKPENGGSEAEKRTKTSILCSKSLKTRVLKVKSAQKPRFCAQKA